jgi:plasmid maintenance system antidote protein VapI
MKKRTKFQELLKVRGITAYKLSKILGYKDHAVYQWIYGKGEPNATTMLKLTKLLDVSAQEILEMFADN